MATSNKTNAQIEQDRTEQIMNIVAERAGFYRENLDIFCRDYLQITNLKWFQKILLWAMDKHDNTLLLACRGLGKTYICALFAVCRAILYPGEQILSVSATFKQSKNLIQKITDDFMLKSPLLRSEILKYSTGQNDCYIQFKSGSIIKAITATESSRGFRSHIILVDESRLIPPNVVSSILRPMNATPRQPGYMKDPQYASLAEMPKEVYLTSAWYSMSDLYSQAKSYAANMLDPNLSYFIVDLPYQVSIREGLLMRQQIMNEMTEATFSDIIFMMEREGKFYGSAADALFDYKVLNERRILQDCLFPLEYYRVNSLKIPEKKKDEIRILSIDIALMGSKKRDNDATCITIHSATPTSSNDYMDNIVYVESQEGLLAEDLGLLILREFYQYDCDYIAIDGSGVGQPIVDYLIYSDRYDPIYNVTYPCLNCANNTEISDRCKVKTAPKVIYVIKANAKSNNDMYLALRAGFQNGYINMLASDINIEEHLSKIRGYSKLSANQKALMLLPYLQTTLMINELINLQCDSSGVLIKVKERTGMRKDRVSSCMYGYNVCQILSAKNKPKNNNTIDLVNKLPIRQSKRFSLYN